jgi:hypothetical protein
LTSIRVIEELADDRRQQKGGREGSRFELCFGMRRAIRMGSPQRYSHSKNNNTKDIYLNTDLGSNSELKTATAVDYQMLGEVKNAIYKLLQWSHAKTQTPNIPLPNIPF